MNLFYSRIITAIIFLTLIGCQLTTELNEEKKAKYFQKGKKIVSESYGALSSLLLYYSNNGNVNNAIGACNLSALPTLDSLSAKYNVKMKRTSLQVRNPLDQPTAFELIILNEYKKTDKEDCKQMVKVVNNKKVAFFSPIFINATCLKCHGEPGKDIDTEDYAFIKDLYPDDKAINYKDGDFRGMWSVTFLDDPF